MGPGVKAVIDTNILVDFLKGLPQAHAELEHYRDPHISVITRLELLVGVRDDVDRSKLLHLLSAFTMIPVGDSICDTAATLRQTHRLKTPDAIIYATAKQLGCLLVTRNTNDFRPEWIDIRCPYTL
jgi:predicted nucleic acid-binding protein